MKRSGKLPVSIVFLILLSAGRVAPAALAHPASWKQVSSDGQYVLVMVSPLPLDEDAGNAVGDGTEIRQIRAAYTQSGLYRNDGSETPLWTIEYFSRPHELHIAPDGEHLIVGAHDWFAGCFFANGNSLAGDGYLLTDLVSFPRVKSLVTLRYPSCVRSQFDAHNLTYTVGTNQGEEFVFDVTTGRVIETRSPWPVYFSLGAAGLVAGLGFAAAFMFRWYRLRQQRAGGITRTTPQS